MTMPLFCPNMRKFVRHIFSLIKFSDLPVSVVVERVVVVAAVVVISVGGVGPESMKSMKISIPCQNLWIPKILG